MNTNGFTKLYSSIITSTIWRESDEVRIVWITMLALANRNGVIEASVPGLADVARVSIAKCQSALEALGSPDKWSRTKDHEGRRIKEVDGGWLILNHAKYREHDMPQAVPAEEKLGKVYFIQCGQSIKIGFSQNPWARMASLKTGMPDDPIFLGYVNATLAFEQELHRRFEKHKVNREWFRSCPEILAYIKSVAVGSATGSDGSSLPESYNTEAEAEAEPFPEALRTSEFKAAWLEWFEYRRQQRLKKYGDMASKKQLAILAKIGSARAIAAIHHSIANSYQGIYEPKNGNTKPHPKSSGNAGTSNQAQAGKY